MIVVLSTAISLVARSQIAQNVDNVTFRESKVIRVALVMGAENYDNVPAVDNALNDAAQIRLALKQANFDSIIPIDNPQTKTDILENIQELIRRAGPPEEPAIIVVFFAGHGFQHGEWNYIVPTTAHKGPEMVADSVPVFTILNALTRHQAGLSVFLFDSCRTAVAITQAASANGVDVDPVGFAALAAPRGAIVSLAAEYGKAARSEATKGDTDSPYTTAMTHYLTLYGESLARTFEQVRDYVYGVTAHSQSPFLIADANIEHFYFTPDQSALDDDRRVWQATLDAGRAECVEKYVLDRRGSRFLAAALTWLNDPKHPVSNPKEQFTCPN